MSSADLFLRTAEAFVLQVSAIRPEQWQGEGLGSWTVRDLIGHTARAISTVTTYLGEDEPGAVTVATAEQYYSVASARFGDDASVALRGVEAGRLLGDEPASAIRATLSRAADALSTCEADRVVSIRGLAMPLGEYLRTRVFELTVHSLDVSRATGVPHRLPEDALAETACLGARTAVARGLGEGLLLALTGRRALPEGFSVV